MDKDAFTTRLIPYADSSDLTRRVANLFDWNHPEDPLPPRLAELLRSSGSPHEDWWPSEELYQLQKYLPSEHPIVTEIRRQAEQNLKEILGKSRDELTLRVPRYLNSFQRVRAYEPLFKTTLEAAYHVVDLDILTADTPPREEMIVISALGGVSRYRSSHPEEMKRFLDHAWGKKVLVPFLVSQYGELGDEKALDIYFEMFKEAKGEDTFVLNGLRRDLAFDYFAKRLQKQFPHYDFGTKIRDIEDSALRNRLETMFL